MLTSTRKLSCTESEQRSGGGSAWGWRGDVVGWWAKFSDKSERRDEEVGSLIPDNIRAHPGGQMLSWSLTECCFLISKSYSRGGRKGRQRGRKEELGGRMEM